MLFYIRRLVCNNCQYRIIITDTNLNKIRFIIHFTLSVYNVHICILLYFVRIFFLIVENLKYDTSDITEYTEYCFALEFSA